MVRERTAQMQLAELWRFPALKRATITAAVADGDTREERYRPRSIRDESVLLSMDDQAVTDIWVV
jgi:hypothetical protein